ncbi:MAG: DUF815 domain-containing protein [Clostridiales bacterium]|nr:DUF815 domain-containing protein [Clostridiales bacterium]
MLNFRECAHDLGAAHILSLVSRLTLVADPAADAPLCALRDTAGAILAADVPAALQSYHRLCRALLLSPARRVSGDLFLDHLLYLVLETPHPFAVMAAEGRMEEAQRFAMRADLQILGLLSILKSQDLYRMLAESVRAAAKPHSRRDNISEMSSALWTGGAMPKPKKEEPAPLPQSFPFPLPAENEWLSWQYGETGLRDSYVSDEALEEVYIRLLGSSDWRSLSDDIWNFFASYGTAPFLKGRLFHVKQGRLLPLPQEGTPYCPFTSQEEIRVALISHAIRFMRGETAEPLLLAGDTGLGKTATVFNLADELPELRLVLLRRSEPFDAVELLSALAAQPLRFLLLLDDADFSAPAVKSLLACRAQGAFPANVLLAATGQGPSPAIAKTLLMNSPRIDEFTEMVEDLLAQRGVHADRAAVRNAAVDHQVDARDRLTVTAALSLADQLIADLG